MTNISCKKTSGQFDGKIAHDIFVSEIVRIFINISLKFVLKDLIYKKSALVQVTAWHRTSNKPLPEPILTKSTDVSMRY